MKFTLLLLSLMNVYIGQVFAQATTDLQRRYYGEDTEVFKNLYEKVNIAKECYEARKGYLQVYVTEDELNPILETWNEFRKKTVLTYTDMDRFEKEIEAKTDYKLWLSTGYSQDSVTLCRITLTELYAGGFDGSLIDQVKDNQIPEGKGSEIPTFRNLESSDDECVSNACRIEKKLSEDSSEIQETNVRSYSRSNSDNTNTNNQRSQLEQREAELRRREEEIRLREEAINLREAEIKKKEDFLDQTTVANPKYITIEDVNLGMTKPEIKSSLENNGYICSYENSSNNTKDDIKCINNNHAVIINDDYLMFNCYFINNCTIQNQTNQYSAEDDFTKEIFAFIGLEGTPIRIAHIDQQLTDKGRLKPWTCDKEEAQNASIGLSDDLYCGRGDLEEKVCTVLNPNPYKDDPNEKYRSMKSPDSIYIKIYRNIDNC